MPSTGLIVSPICTGEPSWRLVRPGPTVGTSPLTGITARSVHPSCATSATNAAALTDSAAILVRRESSAIIRSLLCQQARDEGRTDHHQHDQRRGPARHGQPVGAGGRQHGLAAAEQPGQQHQADRPRAAQDVAPVGQPLRAAAAFHGAASFAVTFCVTFAARYAPTDATMTVEYTPSWMCPSAHSAVADSRDSTVTMNLRDVRRLMAAPPQTE